MNVNGFLRRNNNIFLPIPGKPSIRGSSYGFFASRRQPLLPVLSVISKCLHFVYPVLGGGLPVLIRFFYGQGFRQVLVLTKLS